MGAEAPDTEIEITPAMIEAALEVFGSYETYDPEQDGFFYREIEALMPEALQAALSHPTFGKSKAAKPLSQPNAGETAPSPTG